MSHTNAIKQFSKFEKIKMAYSTSDGFLDFVFHCGYQGFLLPVWFRKIFTKTDIHKAWFSGFYGGGIMGVLDRQKDISEFNNY